MLEPDTPQDFAFADTVHADAFVEPPVPSARAVLHPASAFAPGSHDDARYPRGPSASETPLAFPLPESSAPDASLAMRLRVLWARVRHGVRGALEELAELWAQTAYVAGDARRAAGAGEEARVLARRVHALWSSWEWDRSDLQRASMIGLGVFAAATLAAAIFVASSDDGWRASAGPSAGSDTVTIAAGPTSQVVRAPRTLDQRTGRTQAPRSKARR